MVIHHADDDLGLGNEIHDADKEIRVVDSTASHGAAYRGTKLQHWFKNVGHIGNTAAHLRRRQQILSLSARQNDMEEQLLLGRVTSGI